MAQKKEKKKETKNQKKKSCHNGFWRLLCLLSRNSITNCKFGTCVLLHLGTKLSFTDSLSTHSKKACGPKACRKRNCGKGNTSFQRDPNSLLLRKCKSRVQKWHPIIPCGIHEEDDEIIDWAGASFPIKILQNQLPLTSMCANKKKEKTKQNPPKYHPFPSLKTRPNSKVLIDVYYPVEEKTKKKLER